MPINKQPTPRELRWFGLALLGFFTILGSMILWRTGNSLVPKILWTTGALVVSVYYLAPPIRRPIYLAWMTLTHPIGWIATQLILALVYYGVITPVGLVMRIAGRDTMGRTFDRQATSYWIERPKKTAADRYFRQF
jgi:hypothetical protein